jgi:hypothetical protein
LPKPKLRNKDRSLSFQQAQKCEFAMEERCRCRCGGEKHGRGRLVADLAQKDAHAVPPARITLAELQQFFVVRLERRQRDMFGAPR